MTTVYRPSVCDLRSALIFATVLLIIVSLIAMASLRRRLRYTFKYDILGNFCADSIFHEYIITMKTWSGDDV